MRIFFLITLFLIYSVTPLSAQTLSAPTADTQNQENILDLIPDEFLEEAQTFYQQCEKDIINMSFYDCRCLAAELLDKRIQEGPEEALDSLRLSLEGKCKDETQAAGQAYNICLNTTITLPNDTNRDDFCTCYANRFARMFKNMRARFTAQNRIELQTRANIACQNPALGRELYPEAFR